MKVLLVSSVKGGTGKTLFSLNLALELRDRGFRVGLLDADLTSPHFKVFTKADLRVEVDGERIRLPEWQGIRVFSLGLVQEGPLSFYGFSERQILEDVHKYADWGDIDYLIIDLPAGAEDVFKETLVLWGGETAGGYVIMIPFAEQAARSLIELWQMHEVPILGVVENMAYMRCGDEVVYPFGRPVGEKVAREYGVPYLGAIPLDPRVAEGIEEGNPRLPDDIREPVVRAADAAIPAKPQGLATKLKRAVREKARAALAKALARGLIVINSKFDIGKLREKYGLPGGRVLTLVFTDLDGKPVITVNLKVSGDRIVVVKGKVKPDVIVELPVKTAVDIVMGRRKVAGREVPFDVKTAWAIGELKVSGAGSTPLLLYVVERILADKDIVEEARRLLGPLAKLLG